MKHKEYLLVLLEAVTIDKQSARRYSSTFINHNAGTEASMLAQREGDLQSAND